MSHHKDKFYVTTPIYYGTAKPHLGSLYSTLIADVLTRWNKLKGKKTFFLTGTDEHGQKIEQAAAKAGKDPKAFVDSFIDAYKDTWHKYEIEYNHFIRTTDHYHIKAIQDWLQALIKKGDIYKSQYEGWYCTPCETFVTEKDYDPKTTEGATMCPSCNRETIKLSEETYFFKLSAYQDKLLKFYKDNPDFFVPKERANEVINFVESGLRDLSISRTTVKWGIPFPDDKKHIAYVWADALNNYLTGVGYGQPNKQEAFNFWWPADVQVIGKDIVRFHAVYWPAFLMAMGLPLPKQLLVHGWIKIDHEKMSKSKGNVIDPLWLLKQYGADQVRYYLIREMSINQDTNFSIEALEQRISSDLANDLGNLLNRMVSLAEKNDAMKIPVPKIWSEKAMALRDLCWNMVEDFEQYMQDKSFHMALATLWKFINAVNAYFHAHEPWKLATQDRDAFMEVLSATCHSLRVIAYLLWPVMPSKMAQLLNSLGITLKLDEHTLEDLELGNWRHDFMLKKIANLFEKPEPPSTSSQSSRKASTGTAGRSGGVVEQKEAKKEDYITIDDVIKVHLVVGTIEQCEIVEKSDKLLKMQVNLGDYGMRQILAGVRKYYTPEDLMGKQAVFIANLKPRKMMGMESQGMMLVSKAGDTLEITTPAGPVPNGTRLS